MGGGGGGGGCAEAESALVDAFGGAFVNVLSMMA
jgi:hypothetical protein